MWGIGAIGLCIFASFFIIDAVGVRRRPRAADIR
jgi:hypothetical protein